MKNTTNEFEEATFLSSTHALMSSVITTNWCFSGVSLPNVDTDKLEDCYYRYTLPFRMSDKQSLLSRKHKVLSLLQ